METRTTAGGGDATRGGGRTVCVVSSSGGHLTEVRALRPVYEPYRHFYVLNDRVLEDSRVENVLLTIRDGMNLVWRT